MEQPNAVGPDDELDAPFLADATPLPPAHVRVAVEAVGLNFADIFGRTTLIAYWGTGIG